VHDERGCAAARLRGCAAARLRGCAAARLRGCAAARLCGCAAVRLCGCAAVRLCGWPTVAGRRARPYFASTPVCDTRLVGASVKFQLEEVNNSVQSTES